MTRGTRVLELGEGAAVPFAGKVLAATGADVVKVELGPDGDWTRRRAPVVAVDGVTAGAAFHHLNAGKRLVLVDADDADACGATVAALWSWADVVLVDDRFLALDAVRAVLDRPGPAAVTTVTPFGRGGSQRHRPATPATLFARGGEGNITPGGLGHELHPDRSPLVARGRLADLDAGVVAALVTFAALVHATGRADGSALGRPVSSDVSIHEVTVSNNRWIPSNYTRSGWIETRASRPYPYGGLMRCKDGYCMFLPSTNGHWDALVDIMGRPEWALDEAFATYAGRAHGATKLRAGLKAWALTKSMDELFELGLRHGVPIGPYRSVAAVAACPQLGHRGFFTPYGSLGARRLPGLPAPGFAVAGTAVPRSTTLAAVTAATPDEEGT